MKLTIKELAAYLPYGLKYQKISKGNFKSDKDIIEIKNWVINDIEDLLKLRYRVKSVKPILYPFDYFTKEITHNGETFVPIERLFEFNYPANKSKKYYYDNQTNYIRCSHENTTHHKKIYTNNELFGGNFFKDVEQLIEWKFDVFNLIENNLAIPVTEDFNPYK